MSALFSTARVLRHPALVLHDPVNSQGRASCASVAIWIHIHRGRRSGPGPRWESEVAAFDGALDPTRIAPSVRDTRSSERRLILGSVFRYALWHAVGLAPDLRSVLAAWHVRDPTGTELSSVLRSCRLSGHPYAGRVDDLVAVALDFAAAQREAVEEAVAASTPARGRVARGRFRW